MPHAPAALGDLSGPAARRTIPIESRTMVRAQLGDGQTLLALNEVFVGACTHQSARYRLRFRGRQERHSSSGVIVSTGTGSTGWARSIARDRRSKMRLPQPGDPRLAFFAREAFPSVATGTDVTQGAIGSNDELIIISEMNEGDIIFGDGLGPEGLAKEGEHVFEGIVYQRRRNARSTQEQDG